MKSRTGILLFFLTTGLLCCSSGELSLGQKIQQKAKKKYALLKPIEDEALIRHLQGGVKHAETLPPINSKLKVGALYDDSKLEMPAKMRHWYKLPPFLAGKWESFIQKDFSMDKDGKKSSINTVENHGIAVYGKLEDAKGGIWDYVQVPQKAECDSGQFINKDLTTEQIILSHSEKQLLIKDVFTRRRIEKKSRKIVALTQNEQISSITELSKGKIELIGSLKTFDAQGNNQGQVNAVVIYLKKEAFKPVKFENKEDLRPSFYYFLKKQGLEDLLPSPRQDMRALRNSGKQP